MRTESRVFNFATGFFFLTAATYAWLTDKLLGNVEWAGTVGLTLAGVLYVMCGLYFGFVSRRIAPRPEDRGDAEVADGAGEMGFFSPGSYWPVGIAAAAAMAALGIAIFQAWLVGAGLVGAAVGGAGLLFEYYTGARRSLD